MATETENKEKLVPRAAAVQTVRAVVEYDGTPYFGFQIQPDKPTIQGALEDALRTVTGADIRVIGGGRTDAGVHALGQVISFEVGWRHPLGDLQRAMNAHLPADIAVQEIAEAPDGFHARFGAAGRRYRYSLFCSPVRRPLLERYAWRVSDDLSRETLDAASAVVVGERDFGAFGAAPWGENTVRHVRAAEWQWEDPLLRWYVEANAFLRHMVRSLVSTMVWVASGKMTLESFEGLFVTGNRGDAAPPAPPAGLCLLQVLY